MLDISDGTGEVVAGAHRSDVDDGALGHVALAVGVAAPADQRAADAFDHARVVGTRRHQVWLLDWDVEFHALD